MRYNMIEWYYAVYKDAVLKRENEIIASKVK